MAVGGHQASFSDSINKGCDFLYDYTCSPCTSDGKNKEAIKFCIDCGEYLCGNCLGDHNRFAKMKTHQVVDPAKYDNRRMPPKSSDVPLITIGCNKHDGKVLDMFCGEHNEVCCAACLALDHSTCNKRSYIPDIAAGVQDSQEYRQHDIEYKMLLSQLKTTKQNRSADLAVHDTKKDVIFASIKQLRKDVIKTFDDLEARTVPFIERRFDQDKTLILEDVDKIDKARRVLQSNSNKLKSEKNESQKFVLLKTAEKGLNDANIVLQGIRSSKPMSLDFKLNENLISNCFTGLGNFSQGLSSKLHGSKLYSCKIYSIQNKDDTFRCNMTGFCQLKDGCLVIADVVNRSIKLLGTTLTVLDAVKLQSPPWDVCTFGKKEVAVSLCNEKAIQFVTLTGKNKMQMARSFKIKDACAGIASFEENLLVGLFNRKQIQVYDHSGFPLQTIDLVSYVPWCIAITPKRTLLYVATHENGVISVDTEEQKCRKLDIPTVKFATSVALSDDGSLLISCRESNKIVRYADGHSDIVLSKADGIENPQALCFYRNQELVVASEKSDAIRVYSQIIKRR